METAMPVEMLKGDFENNNTQTHFKMSQQHTKSRQSKMETGMPIEMLKGDYENNNTTSTLPKVRSRVNLQQSVSFSFSEESQHQHQRVIAIRYYLDRPGYGLHDSAARLWFNPPAVCKPKDLEAFLVERGIAFDGLLVEVFLDKIQSFMILDACEACMIEWDFTDTSPTEPGIINIRLTDLKEAQEEENITEFQKSFPLAPGAWPLQKSAPAIQFANVTPSGLFSFSMMVGLETAYLTSKLFPGSVSDAYILKWGPYMFFVGGLMQIIVAIFQVLRNNVYGATAFFGFGSFWFSNGLIEILSTFFASETTPANDLSGVTDPWGNFIRIMFVFAFSCALLVQTFAMNRLSSTLIGLLCLKNFASAFAGFSKVAEWVQFALGWTLALFAYYVFLVEFTNQIYNREVFRVFKWSEQHSPEEVFGAPGRSGTLHSKATRLRQANYPNAHRVRAAVAGSTDIQL